MTHLCMQRRDLAQQTPQHAQLQLLQQQVGAGLDEADLRPAWNATHTRSGPQRMTRSGQ
jgi:hypothetical protein